MSKPKITATRAVRFLRDHRVPFTLHRYQYEIQGGTEAAARELEIDEHLVVKTLVFEDDAGNPFLILMHGDKNVSTKAMARLLGVKKVSPCDPKKAHAHTGYMIGGISPFGTRKSLKIYVEESILRLPSICINAGARGLLAELAPADIAPVLNFIPVNAGIS